MTTLKRSMAILDEVNLKSGKLMDIGCKNLQFVKKLVEHQVSDINFQYSVTSIPTEFRMVVLSDSKSILDLTNTLTLP